MNKELELEAGKFGYCKNGIMSDEAKAYIAGATTSKYVEKQKLEFAIEQLNYLHNLLTYDDLAEDEKIESCKEYIQDLQKKLLNL